MNRTIPPQYHPHTPWYKKRSVRIIILSLCILVFAVVYTLFDPSGSTYFPKCTMKALTGWECPGCGVQRAVHALLTGHFSAAIRFNPFLFLILPYVCLTLTAGTIKTPGAQKVYSALTSKTACYSYIVLYFAWWIFRNTLLKGMY